MANQTNSGPMKKILLGVIVIVLLVVIGYFVANRNANIADDEEVGGGVTVTDTETEKEGIKDTKKDDVKPEFKDTKADKKRDDTKSTRVSSSEKTPISLDWALNQIKKWFDNLQKSNSPSRVASAVCDSLAERYPGFKQFATKGKNQRDVSVKKSQDDDRDYEGLGDESRGQGDDESRGKPEANDKPALEDRSEYSQWFASFAKMEKVRLQDEFTINGLAKADKKEYELNSSVTNSISLGSRLFGFKANTSCQLEWEVRSRTATGNFQAYYIITRANSIHDIVPGNVVDTEPDHGKNLKGVKANKKKYGFSWKPNVAGSTGEELNLYLLLFKQGVVYYEKYPVYFISGKKG